MPQQWRPWRAAMRDSLYGPSGFYRAPATPARHFSTSAQRASFAVAVLALADRLGAAELTDVGAGGGELLAALHALRPGLGLTGVDLAPRPPGLPAAIRWRRRLPARIAGLALAHEWLDSVPLDVVVATEDGLRLVEVAGDGRERPGRRCTAAEAAWLRRWWPLRRPGRRAEVGRTRDAAWARLVRRVEGTVVAVDYAVVPARAPLGTLAGYRAGRAVRPVPDGSCDLTAHVQLRACAAAGAAVTGIRPRLLPQHVALRALGCTAAPPTRGDAAADPLGYLRALARAGEQALLTAAGGPGGFSWLVQPTVRGRVAW